jgi:uroporphyrinogen decarboxylase
MPRYDRDFYEGQLKVVEGLVNAAKSEAVVVVTLYSPYMCAGHTTSDALLTEHLQQEPEWVERGFGIITDSLQIFVQGCIDLGVDGFYHSTQGGEANRFADSQIFEQYIKPYDLVLMDEINQRCEFNILHICDYQRDYDDFSLFLDYPGNIVNCPLKVGEQVLTPADVVDLFYRPYMGGMERKGILSAGTPDQVRQAAQVVLDNAPERFVLAADCTVPNDTAWDNLRAAIDAAHAYSRE